MQTTIQLDRSTVQVLNELKRKTRARSYNDLIRNLVKKKTALPESLFGSHPKMKSFKRSSDDWHEF